MQLTSPAFDHEGLIPAKYTCDGENISPPLEIQEVPAGTISLVLLVDDPDVPKDVRPDGMWDHWVLFNLDPKQLIIPENTSPIVGIVGLGTRGENKYTGPCPPDREHRYFFKLYALDIKVDLNESANKKDLEKAMTNHIIEKTELIGRYDRQR